MNIPPPNRERGAVAVIIMLALLSLLLVLANANSRNIVSLNRELHRLDERQAGRWQPPANRDRPRSQQQDQTNACLISGEAFIVAATIPVGGTGHWPVPSGDPPLGTGKARELFRVTVASANVVPVPSGQWPDGTGGSPVLPGPTSEFGFKILPPT